MSSIDQWGKQSGIHPNVTRMLSGYFDAAESDGILKPNSAFLLDLPHLPDVFDKIPSLRSVELHHNFGSELPPSFASSRHLEHLDVSESSLRRLPEDLGFLPSLKSIDIRLTEISDLPASVDPYRIKVFASPHSDVMEKAYDRLYARSLSESCRLRLMQPLESISSRMSSLQELRSLGQISKERWSDAHSSMVESLMRSSNTLTGTGYAKDEQINHAQQAYYDAMELVNRMAASNRPMSVDSISAINRIVGGSSIFHPNIAEGASYGSFRSIYMHVPVPDQQDSRLEHPVSRRVPNLMKNLVDEINSEMSRLSSNSDLISKVAFATRAASRLASIHPYTDGNGRTANCLMSLILQKYGLPPAGSDEIIIHPGLGPENHTPDSMVNSVVSSMERSLRALESSMEYR